MNLNGHFIFDGVDLELTDLSFTDASIIQGIKYPLFHIINYSMENVNAEMNIFVNSPENGTQERNFNIDVPADTTTEFDFFNDNDIYFDFGLHASQFQVSASVNYEEDLLQYNNSLDFSYDTFTSITQRIMIENAVQNDNVEIWNAQQTFVNEPNYSIINYFADANDPPFYNQFSEARYHYYQLNGFPYTMLNGINKIVGFYNEYEEDLNNIIQQILSEQTTFIESSSISGTYSQFHDVHLNITHEIGNNLLFGSTLSELSLFVGIVEKDIDDIIGGVYLKTLFEKTGLDFDENGSMNDEIEFNFDYDFSTIQDTTTDKEHCEIIYWIQNNNSKKIENSAILPFTELEYQFVSINNENVIPLSMKLFPNPFLLGNDLLIQIDNTSKTYCSAIEIFNLKGQLIKKFSPNLPTAKFPNQIVEKWDGKDQNGKQVTTGIYFIKIRTDNQTNFTKKCILLK
jgi:hypothetical protein